jgi:hypothetical protein
MAARPRSVAVTRETTARISPVETSGNIYQ